MSEDPKLYPNKPKKAQVKQLQQQQQKAKQYSSPAPASSQSSTMVAQASSKPPLPPRQSFARRYKFLWPLLLTVNLGVGAYLWTKKKATSMEEGDMAGDVSSTSGSVATAKTGPVAQNPLSLPPPSTNEPTKSLEPIPENQQRELFKWLLEEQRKIKPKDPEEKRRIDEEKAILKQFIRAKSIPSI